MLQGLTAVQSQPRLESIPHDPLGVGGNQSLSQASSGLAVDQTLPTGSLQTMLFIVSILNGRDASQIKSLKIPDSVLIAPHTHEPLFIGNKPDEKGQNRLSCTPISADEIEPLFGSWLQANMKLQQEGRGQFSPLTLCKADSLNTSTKKRLDFFIASSLKTFNDCLYMSKRGMFGQRQHPLKSSYLIQRFVPARSESATFVYRCSWKKDVGYKVHKITSLVTEDTVGEAEEHIQAEATQPKPKSNRALRDFKLINLGSLTESYKTI